MSIETSHVSVLGLKILGIPIVETPRPDMLQRLYGISRLRPDLDDLEIGHCLFAGDEVTNPHHVGIIARGDGVDVHRAINWMNDVPRAPTRRSHFAALAA